MQNPVPTNYIKEQIMSSLIGYFLYQRYRKHLKSICKPQSLPDFKAALINFGVPGTSNATVFSLLLCLTGAMHNTIVEPELALY